MTSYFTASKEIIEITPSLSPIKSGGNSI